ncbi:SDR family NAD(P)-dependent oxidoreductase [Streptomyces sp. NPDC051554]|uniref:SDR family NAD(P)-dependent oxidoreductase n=1 Tax=Streptomyces sp. NPDC051554 TaxID=3365656 RepID=UPI003788359C
MTAPTALTPGIAPAPDGRPALVDCRTGTPTSYGQLTSQTRAFTIALLRRGLRPGGTVALLLGNDVTFVAAYHGTLRAGGTIQPLDPLAPPTEWGKAVAASRAEWLVAPRRAWQQLAGLPGVHSVRHVVLVDEDTPSNTRQDQQWTSWAQLITEAEYAGELPVSAIDPDAVAVLASSSGTGGAPKHVLLTHRNLAANLNQIHARHHLAPDDVVLAVTPWRHIYGMQMAMNHTLAVGGTLLVTGSPFSLEECLQAAQQHRATVAYLVPPIVARLAADPTVGRYGLGSLRMIFSGGARLAPATAHACADRLGVPVLQGYGMTEAGCTHLVPDRATVPPGSVGLPLPDTTVRITDPDTGDAVPEGSEGELWVRGPQISPGYLHDPAATQALLHPDGWLRTGDLARLDAHGHCTITGRLKELIKYNGHQIAPAELEAILLTHPDVADAAVVGVPDPACGEIPKAFVVLQRPADPDDLMDYVRERVPPQRRIRLIETVEHLPRNTGGKLVRRALLDGAAQANQDPRSTALRDRTVLITGAGRGLGRLLADAFADAGARLVLTGRNPKSLDEAAAELTERQTEVLAIPADLTETDAMHRAVEHAVSVFGGIDVLVNNAGVPGPLGPMWEVDPDEWWHTLNVNLQGTARACRAVIPVMTAAPTQGGRIINIVSEAGHHRWPHASAYSVSKAAVIKLTENLAAELRPHNITVFAFHPGLLDLGVTRAHLARHPTGDPWEDLVGQWLTTQRDEGRFTLPEHATQAALRIAAGHTDTLSGRYLTLDTVLREPARP